MAQDDNCPLCGKPTEVWRYTGIYADRIHRKTAKGNNHICEKCYHKPFEGKSKFQIFMMLKFSELTDAILRAFLFLCRAFKIIVLCMLVIFLVITAIGEISLFLAYKFGFIYNRELLQSIFEEFPAKEGTYSLLMAIPYGFFSSLIILGWISIIALLVILCFVSIQKIKEVIEDNNKKSEKIYENLKKIKGS